MISKATEADVAELADALDLGSSTARCEGSSPFIRILNKSMFWQHPQLSRVIHNCDG
jgi:hypothetical protein